MIETHSELWEELRAHRWAGIDASSEYFRRFVNQLPRQQKLRTWEFLSVSTPKEIKTAEQFYSFVAKLHDHIKAAPAVAPRIANHWGTALWREMENFALAYEGDSLAAITYFDSITERLPDCCRGHWEGLRKTYPLNVTQGKLGLLKWVWSRRNDVNAQRGVAQLTWAQAVEARQWPV